MHNFTFNSYSEFKQREEDTKVLFLIRDKYLKLLGEFIENKINQSEKIEYYKDKDTTYAELNEYYEIPSCDEDGNILWKQIEAVTKHPVINKDGTNTMLHIVTKGGRNVTVTVNSLY